MKKIFVLLIMILPLFNNIYPSGGVIPIHTKQMIIKGCDIEDFKNTLGFVESTNDYKKVNKWGYLGRYQFSKRTLKGLGYKISKKDFLNSPRIQDEALVCLLKHNKIVLQDYIEKYNDTYVNDIHITESGILAAAHLLGPRAVKLYLKSNGKRIKKDGLGTSIEKYLILFSNYDIIN